MTDVNLHWKDLVELIINIAELYLLVISRQSYITICEMPCNVELHCTIWNTILQVLSVEGSTSSQTCVGDGALARVAQRGCSVSSLETFKRHCPALDVPA